MLQNEQKMAAAAAAVPGGVRAPPQYASPLERAQSKQLGNEERSFRSSAMNGPSEAYPGRSTLREQDQGFLVAKQPPKKILDTDNTTRRMSSPGRSVRESPSGTHDLPRGSEQYLNERPTLQREDLMGIQPIN